MSAIATPAAPVSDAPVAHKAVTHLLEYPLISAGHNAFLSIPVAKSMVDMSAPAYKMIRNIQPVKFFVDVTNTACDSTLSTVDSWVPRLQTLEVRDLTDPVTQPLGAAHLVVMKAVVEPTAKMANEARISFHSAVYKDGKAVVSSLADPVVSPVNVLLEKTVEYWLPGTQKVTDLSSEIAKTCLILGNVLTHKREPVEVAPVPEAAT